MLRKGEEEGSGWEGEGRKSPLLSFYIRSSATEQRAFGVKIK